MWQALTGVASGTGRGHIESMAETAGQIVRVTTTKIGGGEPMHVPLVVAEPDPKKAEQLVRAVAGHDEEITAVGPVTANVIEAFGLRPGQFTYWRWSP
jgi:uroporphyrinogen-III synthase